MLLLQQFRSYSWFRFSKKHRIITRLKKKISNCTHLNTSHYISECLHKDFCLLDTPNSFFRFPPGLKPARPVKKRSSKTAFTISYMVSKPSFLLSRHKESCLDFFAHSFFGAIIVNTREASIAHWLSVPGEHGSDPIGEDIFPLVIPRLLLNF